VTGLAARGLALFVAVAVPGFVGIFYFGMHGQIETIWAPLYLGVLLGVYNLGSGRRLTAAIALSQFLIVMALIPTLVLHFSWLAVPSGAMGLAIASLAALPSAKWSGPCQPA